MHTLKRPLLYIAAIVIALMGALALSLYATLQQSDEIGEQHPDNYLNCLQDTDRCTTPGGGFESLRGM